MPNENDLNMAKAQQFRDLILQPILDNMDHKLTEHLSAMEQTVKGMADSIESHHRRLTTLEAMQKRALAGWGVIAAGMSVAVGATWATVKKHINLH